MGDTVKSLTEFEVDNIHGSPLIYPARHASQALEQAAQGSGGVPIPGGVQKACSYGTLGHGLAGMMVLG